MFYTVFPEHPRARAVAGRREMRQPVHENHPPDILRLQGSFYFFCVMGRAEPHVTAYGAAVVPHSGAHLCCSLCCCLFRNILESKMSELVVGEVATTESLDIFLISRTVRPGRWFWMSTHRERTLCSANESGGGGGYRHCRTFNQHPTPHVLLKLEIKDFCHLERKGKVWPVNPCWNDIHCCNF